MLCRKQVFLLLAGLLLVISIVEGQSVRVNAIVINGLKRTHASIVYRELTFYEGDTLPQMQLGEIMERNRNNLLNLGIFNEVVVNVTEWDTEKNIIEVTVDVKESWYIYALPILELADRNFNVWWTTYHHALDRLNLGGRLDFLNFSGRNDKFKAKIQVGYTPKQEIEYRFPYLNKQQSLGITIGVLHSINKEISYKTEDNHEQFIQLADERKLLDRWRMQASALYRPNFFIRYELSLTYQRYKVDDTIVEFNPKYFRTGKTFHSTLITKASFQFDDRDLKIYPSKGIVTKLEIEKTGFGATNDENSLTTQVNLEWNNAFGRRFQQRIVGIGHYSISRNQPSYLYYKGLGYDQNYIRGYELYVVDALDFAIGKYQIAFKFLDKKIKWGKTVPLPQFREMPLHMYVSLAVEAGRAHDPFTEDINPLANRWLVGGGPGVDLVLYNNFLFQLNFSTNHLGDWGFFLHNKTSF